MCGLLRRLGRRLGLLPPLEQGPARDLWFLHRAYREDDSLLFHMRGRGFAFSDPTYRALCKKQERRSLHIDVLEAKFAGDEKARKEADLELKSLWQLYQPPVEPPLRMHVLYYNRR